MFLLLLLQAPGVEALLFLRHFIIVGLDARLVLFGQAVELILYLLIFLLLTGLKFIQCFLLDALETVKGAIALYGVFDNLFDLHAGGIEGQQNGAFFHLRRKRTDTVALEHLRDLHDGVAVRGRLNLGGVIDLIEAGSGVNRTGEFRLNGNR